MESHLLLAMSVHSLFVDIAMSTKEARELKHALIAKLDISVLKVAISPYHFHG